MLIYLNIYGAWWAGGSFIEFVAFRPKRHGFKSRSSRHVGTLGKSFTRSSFGVKLLHSIRDVSGAPLSIVVYLKRRYSLQK